MLTHRQTDKQTKSGKNITSLAEVTTTGLQQQTHFGQKKIRRIANKITQIYTNYVFVKK